MADLTISGIQSLDPSGSTPQPAPLSGLPLPSLAGEGADTPAPGAASRGGGSGAPDGVDLLQLLAQMGGAESDVIDTSGIQDLTASIGAGGLTASQLGQADLVSNAAPDGTLEGFGQAGGTATESGGAASGAANVGVPSGTPSGSTTGATNTSGSAASTPLQIILTALGLGTKAVGLGTAVSGIASKLDGTTGGSTTPSTDPTGYALTEPGPGTSLQTTDPTTDLKDLQLSWGTDPEGLASFLEQPGMLDALRTGGVTEADLASLFPDLSLGFDSSFDLSGLGGVGTANIDMGSGAEALLGGGELGTGAAAGGLGGVLGGVGSGLSGLNSLLGLVSSASKGDPVGSAVGAAGAYNSAAALAPEYLPSLSSLVPGLATAGSAASAVALPIALTSLFARLLGDKGSFNFSDMITGGKTPDYEKFPSELQGNETTQGRALKRLQQAMPYAESKEELGQILNMYRNYLGTEQDAPFTTPSGVYNLTTIPGTTGTEHGSTSRPIDWGPQTASMQRVIDQFLERLPGTALTDLSQMPEAGTQQTRLWNQFGDREKTFAPWSPGIPEHSYGNYGGEFDFERLAPAIPEGLNYAPNPEGGDPAGIRYGQEGYNYEAAGLPKPGEYLGQINPLWGTGGTRTRPAYQIEDMNPDDILSAL